MTGQLEMPLQPITVVPPASARVDLEWIRDFVSVAHGENPPNDPRRRRIIQIAVEQTLQQMKGDYCL